MSDFKNEHRLDLGDIALVLAVGRSGSLTSAAKLLGVSHPTVFRKARTLEARFGTQLFYRDRTGITLTGAGAAIVDVAGRFDAEISALEAEFVDQDVAPNGELRVATVDTLVCGPLTPLLRSFGDRYPEIALDVVVDVAMADISQREVDAAIRAGGEPPEGLVGRKLCGIAVAVYRARGGVGVEEAEMFDRPWVVPDERLSHLASARWLKAKGVYDRSPFKADSLLAVTQAVANDFGLGILPCYLADPDARLERVTGPLDALRSDLWFLTRPELRKVAKVRALSEFLHVEIRSVRGLFEGNAG